MGWGACKEINLETEIGHSENYVPNIKKIYTIFSGLGISMCVSVLYNTNILLHIGIL